MSKTRIEIWPGKSQMLARGDDLMALAAELREEGFDAEVMMGFSTWGDAETIIKILGDANTTAAIVARLRAAIETIRRRRSKNEPVVVKIIGPNGTDVLSEVEI